MLEPHQTLLDELVLVLGRLLVEDELVTARYVEDEAGELDLVRVYVRGVH
jgi:hypothetical protein